MSDRAPEVKYFADNPIFIEYSNRTENYKKLCISLKSFLLESLSGEPHIDRVSARVKSPLSFYKKAQLSKYKDPFQDIEDQIAARIIVFFISDISSVIDCVRSNLTTIEDQFHEPEKSDEFGYESHHLICKIPDFLKPSCWTSRYPNTFELQIRTILMHAYAEPQHNLGYKSRSNLSKNEKRSLAWIAASCWGADKEFDRLMNKTPNTKKPQDT